MFPWEDGTDFPAISTEVTLKATVLYKRQKWCPPRPRLYENVAFPGHLRSGTTAPVYINHAILRAVAVPDHEVRHLTNNLIAEVSTMVTPSGEIMLGYAGTQQKSTDPTDRLTNGKRCTKSRSAGTFQDDESHRSSEAVLRKEPRIFEEEVRWFDLVHRDRQTTSKVVPDSKQGNDLNNPTEFTFEKIELETITGLPTGIPGVVSAPDSSGKSTSNME